MPKPPATPDPDDLELAPALPRPEPIHVARPSPAKPPMPTATPEAPTADVPLPDRPCPQCGFNLKNLPELCRCPGCQLEITRKTRYRDELACAQSSWVLLLARGGTAFLVGMLLLLAHIALDTLQQLSVLPASLHLLAPTLALGYCVALPLGVFFLTTRETRTTQPESGLSARVLARVLALVAFPAETAAFFLGATNHALPMAVSIAIIALVAARTWLVAYFLQQLATRMRDDSLRTQTLNFGWFAALTLLVYAAVTTIAAGHMDNQILCVGVPSAFFFLLMAWGTYLSYRLMTGLFFAVQAAERMKTLSSSAALK